MNLFTDFYEYSFLFHALIVTILLSLTSGLLSPLIIAKRYAFVGSAVSHSTLLGLAVGILLVGNEAPFKLFMITLLVTLILALFLARSTWRQALPSDTMIGLFFTATMGMGTLIHAVSSRGAGDLMSYLFGNVLLLTDFDVIIALVITLITLPLIIFKFQQWIMTTYDEDFSIIIGINGKLYHYIFVSLLTFLIVSALKLSGTVLINSLLLAPGFFALSFARTIKSTFVYSILFALITSLIGLVLANAFELPSGATLAVTQVIIVIMAKIFLKLKG